MPSWEIKGYFFYFKVNELVGNKPAHIHVETSQGEIHFWLEKPDNKTKAEITIKKIKGRVTEEEQNEIKKLVIKNKDLFLTEWNKKKAKAANK